LPAEHAWTVQRLAYAPGNIVELQASGNAARDLLDDSVSVPSTLVITPRFTGGSEPASHCDRHDQRRSTVVGIFDLGALIAKSARFQNAPTVSGYIVHVGLPSTTCSAG
jgi:hypothetical protein